MGNRETVEANRNIKASVGDAVNDMHGRVQGDEAHQALIFEHGKLIILAQWRLRGLFPGPFSVLFSCLLFLPTPAQFPECPADSTAFPAALRRFGARSAGLAKLRFWRAGVAATELVLGAIEVAQRIGAEFTVPAVGWIVRVLEQLD